MDDEISSQTKTTETPSKEETYYLAQLTDKEKIAFETAKSVLGSSFSLKKSIGFTKQ